MGLIFLFALFVRFYSFKNNIYFGFDEARDALVSQSIYTERDFKLIGPPASGDTGMFHGPAYWYLIGPVYLLFHGNLYLVSILFRLINALGIFLVFAISKKLFSERVGYLAAFLYAISFEQSQYSLYVGKESLALILWLLIMFVVASIYKNDKWVTKKGLPIIAICFGLMVQFNIIYAGFGIGLLALGILLCKEISLIPVKTWLTSGAWFIFVILTYILAELKYNFREIRSAYNLIHSGFGIMSPDESKYTLYWHKYLIMFRDNLIGLSMDIGWQRLLITAVTLSITIWLIIAAKKDKKFSILLVWMMSWVGIMLAGGHMAYYTNVGNSVSILIVFAVILEKYFRKYFWLALILSGIFVSNASMIYARRDKGLIPAIKPQPYMNLIDERKIVDGMYTTANGRGFTLRLTGIPYKIQTVWYYLLNEYGYKKYGYYPYWEHGNIAGFPGKLPTPINGTTCLRFLVREPMTGLPLELVSLDEKEENYYSTIKNWYAVGLFTVQEREAIGMKNCHNTVAK